MRRRCVPTASNWPHCLMRISARSAAPASATTVRPRWWRFRWSVPRCRSNRSSTPSGCCRRTWPRCATAAAITLMGSCSTGCCAVRCGAGTGTDGAWCSTRARPRQGSAAPCRAKNAKPGSDPSAMQRDLSPVRKRRWPRRLTSAPASIDTVAAFRPWRGFRPSVARGRRGHHRDVGRPVGGQFTDQGKQRAARRRPQPDCTSGWPMADAHSSADGPIDASFMH